MSLVEVVPKLPRSTINEVRQESSRFIKHHFYKTAALSVNKKIMMPYDATDLG